MFKELPRYCGIPSQTYVKKAFTFDMFYRELNGVVPFFVSTYQFKDPITPIVDSLVWDIDSLFGLRIPYKNTVILNKFCYRNDIPSTIDFSGGKGFHLFMRIEDIIPKPEEKEHLSDKIYSLQVAIAKKFKIQAVDYPTFGRLHFLIRYPTSKYVRAKESNGMYCRNISLDDFDKGLKHISNLVHSPGEVPETPKATLTLDDIIDLVPEYKEIIREDKQDMISLIRAGIEPPTIEAVGLPCLKELCQHSHPRHYERVELGSWLKFIGYTDLAIITFMKNCNWTRFEYATTKYQVSTLKPRYPDCKKLREVYGDNCKNCILNRRRNK